MRLFCSLATAFVCIVCIVYTASAKGQQAPAANPEEATATCNFNDQQQLAVEYEPVTVGKKTADYIGDKVPYGKVWEPGKRPLTLFTNSPLMIAGSTVPVGAYTMYLIPDRKQWTLVLSKNTDRSAKYDKSKDLVRAPMDVGQLMTPEPGFSVYFAHTGPNECTMRVDIADTRAWVPFEQK